MEVRVLDFIDPCEGCIVRPCCSEHCNLYYEFFTMETFESFKLEYSKSIQDELLSCQGISIKENNNEQEKKNK